MRTRSLVLRQARQVLTNATLFFLLLNFLLAIVVEGYMKVKANSSTLNLRASCAISPRVQRQRERCSAKSKTSNSAARSPVTNCFAKSNTTTREYAIMILKCEIKCKKHTRI